MAKAVADVDKETQGGYASNDADSKSDRTSVGVASGVKAY